MRSNVRRYRGFSLPEVMIVVGSFFVVLAALVPSLSTYLDSYQLTIAARDIGSFLQSARMLAVSRDEPALVDFLDRDNFLDPSASVTYVAGTARSMRVTDVDGKVFQGLEPRSLRGVNFIVIPTNSSKQIRYNSRGTINNSDTADPLIRVGNATGTMDVSVSRGGRIQLIDNRAH